MNGSMYNSTKERIAMNAGKTGLIEHRGEKIVMIIIIIIIICTTQTFI